MSELKPCLCGSRNLNTSYENAIYCKKCDWGVQIGDHGNRTKQFRDEAWNTRPTEDKLVEALENIKKHIETVFKTGYEFSATWQIADKALKEVKG